MPTWYIGHRPVLKGRNVIPGETYTNRHLTNPDQVLDGAPDRDTSDRKGEYARFSRLSAVLRGEAFEISRLGGAGLGPRMDPNFFRLGEKWGEHRGVPSAEVLGDSMGHLVGEVGPYHRHSNLFFHGVPSANMTLTGHAARAYGEGAANMGPTQPHIYHGVPGAGEPLDEPGTHIEDKNFNRSKEWFGVPSAQAL